MDLLSLTNSETRTLGCCLDSTTNAVIADKLNLSPHTVKTHKFNIFKKLGLRHTQEVIPFLLKTAIDTDFCYDMARLIASRNSTRALKLAKALIMADDEKQISYNEERDCYVVSRDLQVVQQEPVL